MKQPSEKVRLNKFLADHGVASRRKADILIDEGKVQINGKKVFELGIRIDPQKDSIKVNGKVVRSKPNSYYFIFNKPKNVVTTNADPQGRPTVIEYFKKIKTRLFPVGRLDWDTEGLLLITNDGSFANKVSSPQSKIPKTYHAKLDGVPSNEKLAKLRKGITIVGGRVKALEAIKLNKGSGDKAWIQITITEGKNRQIKKMFEKIGFSVVKLKRIAIGKLKLSGLKIGEYRLMTLKDMDRILDGQVTEKQIEKSHLKKKTKKRKTSRKRSTN